MSSRLERTIPALFGRRRRKSSGLRGSALGFRRCCGCDCGGFGGLFGFGDGLGAVFGKLGGFGGFGAGFAGFSLAGCGLRAD